MTNCLACQYPKNDKLNNHMYRYALLKEFGLNFTYTLETDSHCPKVAKHHIKKAKKAEKKKKKDKKANKDTPTAASNLPIPSTNWILRTSAQTGRNATNPFTTVGKGGSKTTSKAEAKQVQANNSDRQAKASQDDADALVDAEEKEKPTGSSCKALARRGFNFNGRNGNNNGEIFQFVDSHTAANDLKNNLDDYFYPIYSKLEK